MSDPQATDLPLQVIARDQDPSGAAPRRMRFRRVYLLVLLIPVWFTGSCSTAFEEVHHDLRGRQNDHSTARSSHPSLPHPRDRKRQLLLQGQLRNSEKETEGNAIMTRRT
jgi:hypothetical protein